MAANKMKVKINNNDDTRLWRYSEEEDFEGLKSFISTSWETADFIAQYKDDEDDLITIATAQDLKDAFEFARSENKKSLKIFVQPIVHQKRPAPMADLTLPTEAPQEVPEEKTEPKVFSSIREMIVDFLTDEAILAALPALFGALINRVTDAVKAKPGQLETQDIVAMMRAELDKKDYQEVTAHPLYAKFGGLAIPYIAAKIASQQSLYPHFRTETIQQWIQQLIAILQQVLQQTAGGCPSFKDVVIDIEYPAMTDTGKVIHFGVECDLCGQYPIIGDRYKCSMCEDWDCCQACEPQHDHPLIKFKKASKNHQNASFKGLTEIVRQLSGDAAPVRVEKVEEQKDEAPAPDVMSSILDGISGINMEDDLFGDAPDCICGAKMECVIGLSAYGGCSVVFCDGCGQKCWNGKVYHCPNGKDTVHHKNGYDLCPKCGAEKIAEDLREEERLLAEAKQLQEEEQASPVVVEVPEPVVDDFVYADQLVQIKNIMALQSGDQDEHIKTLLVQHKGDISRVVPLLLD